MRQNTTVTMVRHINHIHHRLLKGHLRVEALISRTSRTYKREDTLAMCTTASFEASCGRRR